MDRAAAVFVRESRGEGHDVRLVTPDDLAHPGWRLTVPDDGGAILVAEGEPVHANAVRGVLVRLPHVGEAELGTIASDDRPYVAAECQAFLYAMLSALPCPVVNRPTPNCLAGRFVRTPGPGLATCVVSVVGDRVFGEPTHHAHARRFARERGLTLARVSFDDRTPIAADLWPDCAETEIRHAILELLSY